MKKITFQHWARIFAILVLIAAGVPSARSASAQAANAYVFLVKEIELAELGVPSLEGLAYSPKADVLLAIQSANNGPRQVALIDRISDLRGLSELQGQPSNALNIAFNDKANSLFAFDPTTQELAATGAEPDGNLPAAAAPSARYNLRGIGIQQAQGMDFDPVTGRLFILDPSGKRMWIVTPDEAGNYDGDTALRDNRVQRVDLRGIEGGRLKGLAYNPKSGNLFTLNQKHHTLYEITQNGELVNTRDVSSFGELHNPAGMLFAPSGDTTDNPEMESLYIADPSANTIVEVSITADVIMALPAASPISLVNTINTNTWNPPSPDPGGIDYNDARGGLSVSDGEVEEMSIFKGKNVFNSSLSGSLQSACVTIAFTKEPSGLAVDPATGNLFFSDDSKRILHQATMSPDGQTCSLVRSANMATYGATDPEGIGMGDGKLFIADGSNREVWIVSPGPNGVFDGAGSAGDDTVLNHFDTAGLGLRDPEGIDYHPSRGTLIIVSRADKLLVETSLTGAVQRVFDIGFLNAVSPAGVGIGPGSNSPNSLNVYVSARGVDNNVNPNENDGKIYELNIGDASGPTPTPPPPTPVPDLIFEDDFESGNLAAWSSSTTGGGDLSVSAAAALVGTRGMQALLNDNTAIFVTDETPAAEPHYRARFYFDPNSIPMVAGDNHFILTAYSGTTKAVARIRFRFANNVYQVRAEINNNSSVWTNTAWFTISDGPHALEIDWLSATSAGASDGGLTFWIDGNPAAALAGIPNGNYRIDRVQLGAVNGIDTGTRGTYYFDAFVSHRDTYIGP